jgi:hypothetical protein
MNILRPLKRYLASATAARNASTIDSATVTPTTTRLFSTAFQKNGWSLPEIASRKWSSVPFTGEPRRVEAVDVVVLLERCARHPVDGKDHDHEHCDADEVPARLTEPPPAPCADRSGPHVVSSVRTIWRT